MRLYFFRHAEAEAASSSDAARQLTEKGIQRTQTAATALAALDLQPARVYASPRVRARHTAEILAEALGQTVEIRDELDFSFNPGAVASLINGLAPDSEILFVGHNPSMSDVVTALCGADVSMKKGGMARIDLHHTGQPLRGELVWLIAPKVFDTFDR